VAPASPEVISEEIVWPKRQRIVVKKFTPWAEPSTGQVHRIIAEESRRWGASAGHVSSIIRCESTYRWWAANGPYTGLAQMGDSAFSRGMANMPSRRVRTVDRRYPRRHARLVKTYADGPRSVRVLKRSRVQKVIVIRKGVIPRHPAKEHGHAQVRILAAVVAGRVGSPSLSEWACA